MPAVCPASASAQTPVWRLDVAASAVVEAWDLNGGRESLAGVTAAVERQVWRPVGVRAETLALRVRQAGPDRWLRGVTLGGRARWGSGRVTPFVDLAVGLASAAGPVPPGGTTRNYLALAGAGARVPLSARWGLDLGGRWFHVSNNGREGRHRNPDIQALGATIAVGWSY